MGEFKPICMSEEYWANSQFSIARYYGRIKVGDYEYILVNKEGNDIFECSIIAAKLGKDKAIEAGEPCDLCRVDFVKFYKKLGRDKFLGILKEHNNEPDGRIKKYMENYIKTGGQAYETVYGIK